MTVGEQGGVNGNVSRMQMGCYGLGLTRILAAVMEATAAAATTNDDVTQFVWPPNLSPYKVTILTTLDYIQNKRSYLSQHAVAELLTLYQK